MNFSLSNVRVSDFSHISINLIDNINLLNNVSVLFYYHKIILFLISLIEKRLRITNYMALNILRSILPTKQFDQSYDFLDSSGQEKNIKFSLTW